MAVLGGERHSRLLLIADRHDQAVSRTKCKKGRMMLPEIKSVWCKQFGRTIATYRLR